MNDWIAPVWLTLRLAFCTTLMLMLFGIPLAWWLSQTQSRLKIPVSAIVALPLVLPPTVLGFYLLLAFGPNGIIGTITQKFGVGTLAFSFSGLLIGSILYSLPFAVQPMQQAFAAIGKRPFEVAATLRAAPLDRFFSIALPMAKPGIISGAVMAFAHTIGEFGVVLMIGGNIPGQTRLLSITIYDHVEALEYQQAHILAAAMLLFSFCVLCALFALQRKSGAEPS